VAGEGKQTIGTNLFRHFSFAELAGELILVRDLVTEIRSWLAEMNRLRSEATGKKMVITSLGENETRDDRTA